MFKTTLFAATLAALSAACADVDTGFSADTGSTCHAVCYGDAPCSHPCTQVPPGDYVVGVSSAADLDDPTSPPPYRVFASDYADPVLESGGRSGDAAGVALSGDTYLVVELEDGACVVPAAEGFITCVTDRYELVLELQ